MEVKPDEARERGDLLSLTWDRDMSESRDDYRAGFVWLAGNAACGIILLKGGVVSGMYDIIKELLDAIWSTMEPVGYVEEKFRFSGEEFHKYWELNDKYGDLDPDEIIRQAKATIAEAISRYEAAVEGADDIKAGKYR